MEFKEISIKNFRNFENINLTVSNKNIVFGRNDFGKTNFLHALRYVFDRKLRNKGLESSDYYRYNTEEPIEITIKLLLTDSRDSDLLKVKMHGALSLAETLDDENGQSKIVYIRLVGKFDHSEQIGNPVLYWGGELDNLEKITQRGNFSEIDDVFKCIYVDTNINPAALYKMNKNLLYSEATSNNMNEIDEAILNLNEKISENPRVEEIGDMLTEKYYEIRKENIEIELRSEMEINGPFNHLIPYLKSPNDLKNQVYPTSGDGRQKLLSYALIKYFQQLEQEKGSGDKIYIYLLEEIENSLHKTLQQTLSKDIFEDGIYKYVFTTTHSSDMMLYMDNVELVRIYQGESGINSSSNFYTVPKEFKNVRKQFNSLLSESLFYDRVLLVEGMSELILFEAILEKLVEYNKISLFDLEKIKVLSVEGIDFKPYVDIFKELNIQWLVKTDNDLTSNRKGKYHLTGLNKGLNLLSKDIIGTLDKKYECKNEENRYQIEPITKDEEDHIVKRKVYTEHQELIEVLEQQNIYISKVELEDDLIEVLESEKDDIEVCLGKDLLGFQKWLKGSKKKRMLDFVNRDCFTVELSEKLKEHENFSCLKDLIEGAHSNVY